MKCPKCDEDMKKIITKTEKVFYLCNHCKYFTREKEEIVKIKHIELSTRDYQRLEDWRWRKKWIAIPKLKLEYLKMIGEKQEKYGNITDKDIMDLQIDIWEFGHKKKEK